jgi:hypothetical protein
VTLNFSTHIPAAGLANLLVVYSFTASTPVGTYQASLASNAGLSGTNLTTGQPVQITGAPVNGAVITLVAPTPTNTATFTSTNTPVPPTATNTFTATPTSTFTQVFTATSTSSFTSTSTATPVFTSTHSPTATSTLGIVSQPYPNPSQGGPISVNIQLNGPSQIKFGVFTAAFRKIREEQTAASANTILTWDLRDKAGSPVASGLYYLRIEVVTASGTVVKIKKVLVLQ